VHYPIQELTFSNNTLSKSNPKAVMPSQNKIAIVVHVYYSDIWKDIIAYVNALDIPCDIYANVPHTMPDSEIKEIFNTHTNTTVYMTENRGRDVLPFLETMQVIGTQTYKYICKIHTKKTAESDLGKVWRKLLYYDLLGSSEIVANIIKTFQSDKSVGMITGKNTVLDSQRYNYGNTEKLEILCQEANIPFNVEYTFAAGTMFWVDTALLEPIMQLFQKDILHFEDEAGQVDNTLAHAIERFFGIICLDKNKRIIESDTQYSKLEDQTLDELSALILSQQYHGKDIFTEQSYRITELEALAESLRLKNRLKRLLPSGLKDVLKNIKAKSTKLIKVVNTVKNNPQLLKKVFFYLKRGEIRYLWDKTKEKSKLNISEANNLIEIEPETYFKTFDIADYSLGEHCIDIVIPVYNGYEFLEALFDSIEENTSTAYRLIVINDCSPDEKVKPYLEERLRKHPSAIFIDNSTNLGFVQSVNSSIPHLENHFVILNTDTEVHSAWIERLMYHLISQPNIASTTPFTNAGTIASFPTFIEDNAIFLGQSLKTLDHDFKQINPEHFYSTLPTGVGFCMGVNFDLVKEIGFFDAQSFGKGYCEENDWCQRASKHGYKNIFVPNLFVFHKHGGSFPSAQKQKLINENHIKLLQKHPNYDLDVQKYIQQNPHESLRNLLILVNTSKQIPLTVVFDHDLGGGANIYANALIAQYKEEKRNVLLVRYDFYSNSYKLIYTYDVYHFGFTVNSLDALKYMLSKVMIKELFLNTLVSYKDIYEVLAYINTLVEEQSLPLTIPIHDYYPVSPNYTLLNAQGEYCKDLSLAGGIACLDKNDLEWKSLFSDTIDLALWRKEWLALLEKSSSILCFSNASKEIVMQAYESLPSEAIDVIPHIAEPLPTVEIERDPHSQTITIGILGAINYAKGTKIIKDMLKQIKEEKHDIKIVLIGEMSEYTKSKHFHVTGRYKRHELPAIIKTHKIDMFLIPSVWPETFSYTSQEIMMMHLPLMVFDLGAPAERVKNYDKGYIIEEIHSNAVLETVKIYKKTYKL